MAKKGRSLIRVSVDCSGLGRLLVGVCTTAHTLYIPLYQVSCVGRTPTATAQQQSSGARDNSHSPITQRQSETIYIVYLGCRYPLGVAYVDRKC